MNWPSFPPYGNTSQSGPHPGESKALDIYLQNIHHDAQQLKPKRIAQSNLSPGEWRSLMSLENRTDIVIKPADKGGAVVVWSQKLYPEESASQHNNSKCLLNP